ncbi:MAG: hypothetical protein OXC10_01000 [Rhodospirillaceae bacterium]|nr:hypothetical protein [Rhodospirillaceae bacterium]
MRQIKTAALGLCVAGFVFGTAGAAFACPMAGMAQSEKPKVEQTVVTNTTDTTKKKQQ